jgi:autotransporter-associated beta strand protein
MRGQGNYVRNVSAANYSFRLFAAGLLLGLIATAGAQTWDGGGANGNWTTGANWNPAGAPANNGSATITFAGTVRPAVNLNSAQSIAGLLFSSNATAFTLSGSNLTLGTGGLTSSTTSTETLAANVMLGGNQTWSVTSGGAVVLTGSLLGTGTFTTAGAGSVTLSGVNTFTGNVSVSAGTLVAGSASALGSTSNEVQVASGGTLGLKGGVTFDNYTLDLAGTGNGGVGALNNVSGTNTWQGPINLTANSTIGVAAGALTISGAISDGTPGNSLTLDVGSGANLTIANGITDPWYSGAQLTKNGAGTATITAATSYTGNTTVNAGILQANVNSALGVDYQNITVNNGATLAIGGTATTFSKYLTLNGAGVGNAGALEISAANVTWVTTPVLGSAATIGVNSGSTLSLSQGLTANNYALTFTGGGVTSLGNSITSPGDITISAGTLQTTGWNQISSNTGTLTINSGATFDMSAGGGGQTLGGLSGAGNLVLGSSPLITGGSNVNTTFSGIITGSTSSSLTQNGTGIFLLSGNDTGFSGCVTISEGTIRLGSITALGTAGTLTLANAASTSLDLNGYNASVGALTGGGSSGGNITLGSGTLTVGGGPTVAGYTGVISGSGGLTKTGTNLLNLGAVNTYTGSTTINGGTLQMGVVNALSTSTAVTLANTAGATFDLNSYNTSVGSLSGGGASGGNVTLGTATLTTGGSNASTTYAGVISGGGGLTKTGTGQMILSGQNTFSGTVTVVAGTLELGASGAGALGSVTSLDLTGGTLLMGASNQINNYATVTLAGGTFNSNGFSEGTNTTAGLSTLTLSSNSTISLGASGSSIVSFSNSSGATWSAGAVVDVEDWNGNATTGGGADQVYFGTTNGGLTTGQLNDIIFVNPAGFAPGNYNASILSSGEIVPRFKPAPEPSTVAAGATLLLLTLTYEIRRRSVKPERGPAA